MLAVADYNKSHNVKVFLMTNYKEPTIADIARHFKIPYDEAEIICDLANSGNKLAQASLDGYADSCEASLGTRPDLYMAKKIASQFRRAREEERQKMTFFERHPFATIIGIVILIIFAVCNANNKTVPFDDDSEYDDYEQIGNCKYLR